MTIKNSCTPASVYGPYEQTWFLGCSVLSFSASAGWNGQNSEVTIELAQDDCESPDGKYKYYWVNETGTTIYSERQATQAADPGFTFPNIGAPAYFRVQNFEYAGLIQGWTVKEGSGGNPVYSVKLVDPRPILDHVQIILDHYEGAIVDPGSGTSLYNLLNVYAYLESADGKGGPGGEVCQDKIVKGTGFGAPALGFGGARKTSRGIPWNLVKAGVQDLAGSFAGTPDSRFSIGGLFFRGGSGRGWGELNSTGFPTFGHEGTSRYIVDLTDLPDSYTWDYRIVGPVISLSDLINQVAEEAGVDYYVELLPTGSALVIKVRTISRFNQPTLGVSTGEITDFITQYNINHPDPDAPAYGIISDSFGRELRSEVNSSFIMGAKARQYYEEEDEDNITPFWGWDLDGELIMSRKQEDEGWSMRLDFRKINLALHNAVGLGLEDDAFGWVNENELRWALGDSGSFGNFILQPGFPATVCKRYLRDTLDFELTDPQFQERPVASNVIDIKVGWPEGKDNPGKPGETKGIDLGTFFNWLNAYATDFYGKQFLVQAPYLCTSVDTDTRQRIFSDEPSTEGGWASLLAAGSLSDNPNVLGLPNPSYAADIFKDEVGKFQAMVKYTEEGVNIEALDDSDYVIKDDELWVKAEIDQEWVSGNPISGQTDTDVWSALLKISSSVTLGQQMPLGPEGATKLLDAKLRVPMDVLNIDIAETTHKMLAFQEKLSAGTALPAALPSEAGVPVLSNTRTYGPWVAIGANPGAVHAAVDDGLAPWEYGSIQYMNVAGTAKVINSVTKMQVAERGEVSVPGYPEISLGSALEADPPNGRYENRSVGMSTHGWANKTWSYNWVSWSVPGYNQQNTAGASVSNVNVSVGAQGVTTSYTISTFTPVFGRFAKDNAERVKQLGLSQFHSERERRAMNFLKRQLKAGKARAARSASADIGLNAQNPGSAGVLFCGKLQSDPKRKIVVVADHHTLNYYGDYDNTSMMTMDGLIRPVSNYGDADLPKIADNDNPCAPQPTQAESPPPPVVGYTGLPILQKYLDFLADPISNTDMFSSPRAAGSDSGHDVEGVARESIAWLTGNQPSGTDGMLLHAWDNDGTYAEDYRYLAMRGPLVIHGWGYDIHGKPVPNSVGDESGNWQDNYAGLTDKFKEDWLSDAREWPAAPVDLRFDRKRGVWTTPPAFRMYQIQNTGAEIAAGGSASVKVLKHTTDLYDADGVLIPDPNVEVENWTRNSIGNGAKGLAWYDTAECKYWIIPEHSGVSGSDTDTDTSGIGVACSTGAAPDCGIFSDTPDYNLGMRYQFINFGSGINAKWITGPDGEDGVLVSESGGRGRGAGEVAYQNDCVIKDDEEWPDFDCVDYNCLEFGVGTHVRASDDDATKFEITGPHLKVLGLETGNPSVPPGVLPCGDSQTECTPFECVTFEGFYSRVEDGGCDVTIRSPNFSTTGWKSGTICQPYNCVMFSGFDSIAWPDCNIAVIGPKFGGTGCGTSIPMDHYKSIEFSSGLKTTTSGTNGCHMTVMGPKVGAVTGTGGPLTAGPINPTGHFDWLLFGSGLTLTQSGCSFTVTSSGSGTTSAGTALQVGGTGCLATPRYDIDPTGCQTLIFSTGLFLETGTWTGKSAADETYQVTGPKIFASGNCSDVNCCNTADLFKYKTGLPFERLHIGSGLLFEAGSVNGLGPCDYTLRAIPWSLGNNDYLCDGTSYTGAPCSITTYKGIYGHCEWSGNHDVGLAIDYHGSTEDSDLCEAPTDKSEESPAHTNMLELGIGLTKIESYTMSGPPAECKTLIAKNLRVGDAGPFITGIDFLANCDATIPGTYTAELHSTITGIPGETCGNDDQYHTTVGLGTVGISTGLVLPTGICCSGDTLQISWLGLGFCSGLLQKIDYGPTAPTCAQYI